MNSILKCVVCVALVHLSVAELPTLYQYYTKDGIKSGLDAEGQSFKLNGKEFLIHGGSMHYFRVPQQYWKDRLLKMKAAGLNSVQLYTPWNLHEETPGNFNFDGMLDLDRFLQEIKDADMFAVFRPGPYICSEWDMGGLPAWLLRDKSMKVRSDYQPFLSATQKYFEKLMSVAKKHQFKNGGPIIAIQIENEFGSFGNTKSNKGDMIYLTFLKNIMKQFGMNELMFTCEPNIGFNKDHGGIPGTLISLNFNTNTEQNIKSLRDIQPNRPAYVSEFWSSLGWYNKWGDHYQTWDTKAYANTLQTILNLNSSFNVYMFHGGTNFGFMNGAYVITSYDYDAPLTEAGDYHQKYWKTKEIIENLEKAGKIPKTKRLLPPQESKKAAYGVLPITHQLSFNDMLQFVKPIKLQDPVSMEMLNISENVGQNVGFIHYRTSIPVSKSVHLVDGVMDRAIIMIDNNTVAVQEWNATNKKPTFNLKENQFNPQVKVHKLDILVENVGRANFGREMNVARRGLLGKVFVDEKIHQDWTIFPLEFKESFISQLNTAKWNSKLNLTSTPALFKTVLHLKDKPQDTFLKMTNWKKGSVFVNGFNLGRYFDWGPQKTLYVPAPILKVGDNQVIIFELHSAGKNIEFVDKPIL